jgi:hypothetical protein
MTARPTPTTFRIATIVVACVAAAAALAPASALAMHHVTAFSLTVADPQAGASVNASSSTSLTYDNASEDVKKTIGHFAPGMLANPEAVPHCPQQLYLADACPADTRIGDAEADISVWPGAVPPVTERGRIYNQELLADEAGRLGIIVDTAPTKTFLTAPFYVRVPPGDGGLDGVLDNINPLTDGVQISRLSFTLYGVVNGRKYTRGPTSCSLKVSTGEAFGYEHTDSVSGPSSSYTPTGCDKLPFKPTFAMSIGSRGNTGFNDHPPLSVTVTQQPGEAGVLGNGVTLPLELTPNIAAFQTLCSEAQLAAGACPAGSHVGGSRATSPFLATPLSGPVWLVQKTGSVLPTLVADLKGRVPIKISIENSILGGRQIKATVANVPDLPIGSFSLALDGGKEGVLLNKKDLCFADRSSSRFRSLAAGVTFTGHNGATTNSTPRIDVEGCGQGISASLKRARSKPRLSVTVKRHPDAEKLAQVELVLPRELRLVKSRIGKGASAKASAGVSARSLALRTRRRLRISGLPKQGASKLVVRLRRGALRSTGKLRKVLHRKRSKRLRLKVVATDIAGKRFTTRVSVRAKR